MQQNAEVSQHKINKAIILTRCPVSEKDRALLNVCDIFKICVNWCDLAGDLRVFHDSEYYDYYENTFTEALMTHVQVRHLADISKYAMFYGSTSKFNTPKKDELIDRAGTIGKAFDFCAKFEINKVLLIADNSVHDRCHRAAVNSVLTLLRQHADVYQFSDGNFRCPVMSIQDFINL